VPDGTGAEGQRRSARGRGGKRSGAGHARSLPTGIRPCPHFLTVWLYAPGRSSVEQSRNPLLKLDHHPRQPGVQVVAVPPHEFPRAGPATRSGTHPIPWPGIGSRSLRETQSASSPQEIDGRRGSGVKRREVFPLLEPHVPRPTGQAFDLVSVGQPTWDGAGQRTRSRKSSIAVAISPSTAADLASGPGTRSP
jgi:hypothetical protein